MFFFFLIWLFHSNEDGFVERKHWVRWSMYLWGQGEWQYFRFNQLRLLWRICNFRLLVFVSFAFCNAHVLAIFSISFRHRFKSITFFFLIMTTIKNFYYYYHYYYYNDYYYYYYGFLFVLFLMRNCYLSSTMSTSLAVFNSVSQFWFK